MADDFSLNAKLTGDTSALSSALQTGMSLLKDYGLNLEKMTEEGSKLFKQFGVDVDQFAKKFGVSSELMLGMAGFGIAAFEVGKQIFEVGQQFDEAFSVIGKGTGASADQLAQFGDDFEAVMGSGVVQDINDVASAFTLLQQKLGLSDDQLVSLTEDFSKFADITHQSVTQSVQEVTDVMLKWNITADQAPELMDQLTKAWQISGVSVAQLTEELTRNEAEFAGFGLSLSQSIGLVAAFAKDGVNAQAVTTGFRTALVNLANAGEDMGTALQDTFAKIQSFASATDAAAYASTIFGNRAGPEMANAIRTGSASIADFTAQIQAAGGTVERTDEQTETLEDKWKAFGNQVKADLAPLGTFLVSIGKDFIDTFQKAVQFINDTVGPIINGLVKYLEDLKTATGDVGKAVKDVMQGDWKSAWTEAQIIVLQAVKSILDLLSGGINGITGLINSLIGQLNNLGVKIPTIPKLDLGNITGINKEIQMLNASLNTVEKTTVDLGKAVVSTKKELTDLMTEEVALSKLSAASALADYQQKQKAIEEDKKLQTQHDESTKAWIAQLTSIEQAQQAFAAVISNTMQNVIGAAFDQLGQDLEKGKANWADFGKAAVHALASVVKGLGDQMAAKAALDYAQAVAYSSNPFTAPAAPGYYAQAAVEVGASAAAYTAAGALSAFERGTPYSTGGFATLAEAGPELVMSPSIHSLAQGSTVLNAADTAKALGGKGTTLQFNIGSIDRNSVGDIARRVQSIARQMAFTGVI